MEDQINMETKYLERVISINLGNNHPMLKKDKYCRNRAIIYIISGRSDVVEMEKTLNGNFE